MSFAEQALQDKIEIRREFQRMYKHSAERAHDIRTRVLPPEKEAVRKKILHRYTLEKRQLCEIINDLGEEIWKMQKEMEEARNNG